MVLLSNYGKWVEVHDEQDSDDHPIHPFPATYINLAHDDSRLKNSQPHPPAYIAAPWGIPRPYGI